MPNNDKDDERGRSEGRADPDEVRDELEASVKSDVPPLRDEDAKELEDAGGESENESKEGEDSSSAVPPDLVPAKDDEEDEKPDASEPEEKPADNPDDQDDPTPFDDEKTNQAIDEITIKEGDDLLAAQDASVGRDGAKPSKKRGRSRRFWRSKWTWYTIIFLLLSGTAAAMIVPTSRYWALNTAGVRSTSSVVVMDNTTQLPLKGVNVTLGGKEVRTDSEGRAAFQDLRLGPSKLVISQLGFKKVERNVTIGWGSNPLGDFLLRATGVQFFIEVKDYLSEKPLKGVEATAGQSAAISDKNGKITLTLDNLSAAKDGVTLSKPGYRTETVQLNENPEKPTKAAMVLARKVVFVTDQSGKYDVYKSDLDGENRELLLPGTGHETSNISLAVSPDGKRAAFVSTRDNKRDSDGVLLSSLVLIDTEDGSTSAIAEAPQIQLVDWVGERIVYLLAKSDGSAGDRYTLASYDYADNIRLQLAAANSINAVMSVQGLVYYSVAGDEDDADVEPGLFRIQANDKNRQQIFDGALSAVFRSTYDTLTLQTADGDWRTYDIPDAKVNTVSSPSSLINRSYADNADSSASLWVNQGSLMVYDTKTRIDTEITADDGLTYPLRWLTRTVAVYRVSNGSETADYAVSTEGGIPRKVADVAPAYGIGRAQ